jgi:hypothetical protein
MELPEPELLVLLQGRVPLLVLVLRLPQEPELPPVLVLLQWMSLLLQLLLHKQYR